jgi:hypothetical protein
MFKGPQWDIVNQTRTRNGPFRRWDREVDKVKEFKQELDKQSNKAKDIASKAKH